MNLVVGVFSANGPRPGMTPVRSPPAVMRSRVDLHPPSEGWKSAPAVEGGNPRFPLAGNQAFQKASLARPPIVKEDLFQLLEILVRHLLF